MADFNIPEHYRGTYITTSKGLEKYESLAARVACRQHILKFYPETSQTNILMTGEQADIDKMKAFINQCRAWSNQEDPKLDDLYLIEP
ncbi:hypothetical protein Q1D09_004327 [Salmonella enterica]|nr:hypothetical protein [Salmonella enterica]